MKIVIIGANGFTGRRILKDLLLKTEYTLTGCSLHQDIDPSSGYRFIKTDICDRKQLMELFENTNPDIVINTSALSIPDYCENHHNEADKINIDAVEHLAQLCNEFKCKLIHLSTDFVFDGKSTELYTETDIPNPINYYGSTKWEGEKRVESICKNYAIVRVVVVYGKSLPGQHGNIIQLVANKLRNNEVIKVVSDQWRTPTYVGDISQGVEKLISYHTNGIFHICGKDILSIAEIAYKVADYLKLDKSLIQPVTTIEMNEITPRPKYSGLNIKKAEVELNYRPHSIDEGIKCTFNESEL